MIKKIELWSPKSLDVDNIISDDDFEDIDHNDEDLIPNEQNNADFSAFSTEILNSRDFKITSIENEHDLAGSTITVNVTDTGLSELDTGLSGYVQPSLISNIETIDVIVLPRNDSPEINKEYDDDGYPKAFDVEPAVYDLNYEK